LIFQISSPPPTAVPQPSPQTSPIYTHNPSEMTSQTLYDDPLSRNGYKVRLLLSHLGSNVRVVTVDITKRDTRTPQFLAKNPAGRIPLLELSDGTCLPESGAILCFLAEGTRFLPSEPMARAQVLRWMFYEQNQVRIGRSSVNIIHLIHFWESLFRFCGNLYLQIECTIGTARFYKKFGLDKRSPKSTPTG